MKNAMKKLMSLLLVTVLLVSMCPMQAFATEDADAAESVEAAQSDLEALSTEEEVEEVVEEEAEEEEEEVQADNFSDEVGYAALEEDTYFSYDISITYENGEQATASENLIKSATKSSYTAAELAKAYAGVTLSDSAFEITITAAYRDEAKEGDEKTIGNLNTSISTKTFKSITIQATEIPVYTVTFAVTYVDKDDPNEATLSMDSRLQRGTSSTITFAKIQNGTSEGTVEYFTVDGGTNKYYKGSQYSHGNVTEDTTVEIKAYVTVDESASNNSGSGSSGSSGSGSSSGSSSSSGSGSSKFPSYKVTIHFYLNNKIDEPHTDKVVTNTLARDGVISLGEVEDLAETIYKAKNSKGLVVDGLYMADGDWRKNFVLDENKKETLWELDPDQQYIHINVMVSNAVVRTTSTADSSNPKTGDSIYMAVTVMGLTASALAVMFYLNKKRAI